MSRRTRSGRPDGEDEILGRYLALSRQAADQGAQAILWPESSTPFYFEDSPKGEAIRLFARERGASVLLGSDEIDRRNPRVSYNSAFMVRPDGSTAGVYRKVRLVPFGEYVPFRLRPVLCGAARGGGGRVRARRRAGDAAARRQTREHGHLLRSGVPCADSRGCAAGQHAADHDHERCLVRPLVGAVPAFRDGFAARHRTGPVSRALCQHGHQRHRRSLWTRADGVAVCSRHRCSSARCA